MKKLKKLLCLTLAVLMMASLAAVSASASTGAVAYADANEGDLLYEFDFNGDLWFDPVDGRHFNWNETDAQVSEDGKSVTVTYTDKNSDNPDGESKSRARFVGSLEDYSVIGNSYTLEFTVQSDVRVGIMLDGGCGFSVNPKTKNTWIGQYGSWANVGKTKSYEGHGSDSNTDTYAIEISFGDTMTKGDDDNDCYAPEVYKLYVKDTNDKWTLIREVDASQAGYFDWEISSGAEYFFLDFAIVRYHAEMTDADGNPTLSTVSDVKLYKGIDFIEVNEIVEEPEEEEEEGEEENGGATNNGSNNTSRPAPTPVETKAPETEAQSEVKTGCGASVAMSGVALAITGAAMLAIKRRKNEEE